MSHVVTIKTQLKDPVAVSAACRRLHLQEPVTGTAKLFSGQATGLLVQLSGWKYPVVIDTASGNINYDNFQGHWGNQVELDGFLQSYAVEKATLEARRRGHTIIEQQLQDGSIKLKILEGS